MSQNNQNILPDSISGIPHIAAFDAVAFDRFDALEIENLLVYIIDTVQPSALPYLANQFDIEGFSGYRLATTDQQRRDIIKQAIELKRYSGTVWAIKQAMLLVGFLDAELIEGIDTGDPDTDWARFSINSEIGDTIGVDGVTQSYLAKLVRAYKPARSYLEGISYAVGIVDVLSQLQDKLNIIYEAPTLDEDLGYFARFYNGDHNYDGSIRYIESLDSLEMTQINLGLFLATSFAPFGVVTFGNLGRPTILFNKNIVAVIPSSTIFGNVYNYDTNENVAGISFNSLAITDNFIIGGFESTLEINQKYYILISEGQIQSIDGEPFEITDKDTWTFEVIP